MNHNSFRRLLAGSAVLCLYFVTSANADVLVLKNGDRISGDVKHIWDAEVTIEPTYSDEFKVDLDAIAYIESDREFEVELDDGTNIDAQLHGADVDGNQIIRGANSSVAVPLSQLFELDEPEKPFEWDSNVEIAASLNKGNTDTATGKLRADTTVKLNDHRHLGEATFYREELNSISTKEQDLYKYSYNWLFGESWFFSADLSYERDPIILLDKRIITSAGLGIDIWNTPRRALSVILGAGYLTEQLNSVSSESTVANWNLRYRHDFFGDDLGFFHNQNITRNLTGRDNTSYKTSTGLSYEISDLLSANVTLDYNYETEPVDLAKNEDIAFLLGLVAEF